MRLLLGTSRGELLLLHWDDVKQELKIHHQIKDCGFALACCEPMRKRNQVLLGGRNNQGLACIYSFALDADKPKPEPLWRDPDTAPLLLYGTIHRLKASANGDSLWAINRDRARLYSWSLGQETVRRPLAQPQIWLDNVHKLFALDYDPHKNLLVCGGDGGMVLALEADTGATRWVVNVSGNLRQVVSLPKYPCKPVWLLCGDDQSSLLVDADGHLLGVIEKAGPVSALAVSGKRLFLGLQNGRIVQFAMNQPETISPSTQTNHAVYPIRAGLADIWSKADLRAALREKDLAAESLPAMRVLLAFAEFIAVQGVDESLSVEFNTFFRHPRQTLERRIVFLYRLRDVCKQKGINRDAQEFVLNLLETCFKYKIDTESGLLCKIISPILDILDNLLLEASTIGQRAYRLRKSINAWVWYGKLPQVNIYPAPDPKQLFPKPPSPAIPAIRINQALKRWFEIDSNKQTSQRLFEWCNALMKEAWADGRFRVLEKKDLQLKSNYVYEWCHASLKDDDAANATELRAHLAALFRSGLVLVARDDPWQNWLTDMILGGPENIAAPMPLDLLESPQGQVLPEKVLII